MNSRILALGVVAIFWLLGGQPACGVRSQMLHAPEIDAQAPSSGGSGATGPGGTGGGGVHSAGGSCVGSCLTTGTQTNSGTTFNTSTASAVNTSTQVNTKTATSVQTATATSVANTPGKLTVAAGGYVTSGSWHGFAWTGIESPNQGTVISPSDFSGLPDDGRLCAKGTVGPLYEAVGLLGLNLNESRSGVENLWVPDSSSAGLAYDLTNPGDSELRIQIQGAAGWPSEAWCAVLTADSGKISWKEFKTDCWAGYGSVYDGTPLQSVMILVPGSDNRSVSFDFCLNSLGPI